MSRSKSRYTFDAKKHGHVLEFFNSKILSSANFIRYDLVNASFSLTRTYILELNFYMSPHDVGTITVFAPSTMDMSSGTDPLENILASINRKSTLPSNPYEDEYLVFADDENAVANYNKIIEYIENCIQQPINEYTNGIISYKD